MLEPITKKMTDRSTQKNFQFIFHCDVCHHPWDSVPMHFSRSDENGPEAGDNAKALIWQSEHAAAYERANHEGMAYFNRCPVCKRWVCDKCFRILGDRDVCKECAEPEKAKICEL